MGMFCFSFTILSVWCSISNVIGMLLFLKWSVSFRLNSNSVHESILQWTVVPLFLKENTYFNNCCHCVCLYAAQWMSVPLNIEGKTLFHLQKAYNAMKVVNLPQISICFPYDPMGNVHSREFILIFNASICFSSLAGRFQLYQYFLGSTYTWQCVYPLIPP